MLQSESSSHFMETKQCFDLELQLIVWQSEDIQFNTHMTAVDKLQRFALLWVRIQ
jgi:hypothetical protein